MDVLRLAAFMNGVAAMFILSACFYFLCKRAERLKRVTSYILAFWSLLLIKEIFLFHHIVIDSIYLRTLLLQFDMFAVPCCAFFLFELAKPGCVTLKLVIWHELPYLLFAIAFALSEDQLIFQITALYSLLYGLWVTFKSNRSIKRYKLMIKENYSNIDQLDIRWLWKAVCIFFFFLLIWLIACLNDVPWIDTFYYVCTCILWGLLCFYTDKQESPSEDTCPLNEMPQVTPVVVYPFVDELNIQLKENKIYMNTQLNITDLAMLIGTNRTYLSDYLNNQLHTTFYDYINGYRLEVAVQYLSQSGDLTIEEIAMKCGFNSVSTFRRSFQKAYECTPKEYRKANIANMG